MSPREVLFIANLASMVICGTLAWVVIFFEKDANHMRKTVLGGLIVLFLFRLFAVMFATLTLGPAWET